ncbi:hypothetical protein CLV28_2359 [Sediminihabitans luteus]|uniref:Uncharacterized protein n=1 Tax=Sediminihabitans luteus TaxID=1138585 RepID=A0A2M9CDB2_9CELL|nr:hypothetical protein [Sediminihabitans luteus]PJJ69883.1 hypothetical protein CLV28_2359 [Sediminihabitans luteus]GII99202.1 hypothetical protein Slu03_15800 [Sediminihabitans luteus]
MNHTATPDDDLPEALDPDVLARVIDGLDVALPITSPTPTVRTPEPQMVPAWAPTLAPRTTRRRG